MEILPGIHKVDGVNCNCYFVKEPGGWALIDTGMPKNDKKILLYLRGTLGGQPSDVKTIIITHAHVDHVGSLDALKKATGAEVAAHEADADYIAGKKPAPMPASRSLKFLLFRLLSPFMKAAPVEVDVRLKEHDTVAGLKVIHTPGHTPGSICLLNPKRHVLFVGDLVRFVDGKVVGPPITLDELQVKESMAKISKLEFDVMLSGHGEPLRPDAAERVREFIKPKRA